MAEFTALWRDLWSSCTAQLSVLQQPYQPSPGQRTEWLLSTTLPTSASGAPAVECLLPHHLLLIAFSHQTMAAMCVRLGMVRWLWTAPHCLSRVSRLREKMIRDDVYYVAYLVYVSHGISQHVLLNVYSMDHLHCSNLHPHIDSYTVKKCWMKTNLSNKSSWCPS